jgi:DNA-binding MarR family transcriptional regulator
MDVYEGTPTGTAALRRGNATTSPRATAEVIEQITQLAYRFGFASDLRPAQWTALRFFDRSPEEARTVSAFAEFNRTSRSSASQTINGLVNRGLLMRIAVPQDRRTHRLQLTGEAQALLAQDPLRKLEAALEDLEDHQHRELASRLEDLLAAMLRQIERDGG